MKSDYEVIARRWRPKRFSELVGQEAIVRTLKNAIDQNRLAHAYLFIGPRGTGKTTTARLLAMALNAPGGPSSDADPDSERAQRILRGNCLDVIEIDGASNNGVDQVRQLREECQYAPTECTFKVYIIDEVHMLSGAAFNALLKTLEEPPAHVKFIFATTEVQKVPATIASRCQRFSFRPIPHEIIVDQLQKITQAEGILADIEALQGIATLADGGMRDAQSLLDQLIAFCGKTISQEDLINSYGLASRQEIDSLVKAIAEYDLEGIARQSDELSSSGRDLHRVLESIESAVRQALLKAVQTPGHTLVLFEKTLYAQQLLRMLDILHEGKLSFAQGLSEQVHFEVLLLKTAHEGRVRSIDSLIQELAGKKLPPAAQEDTPPLKPAPTFTPAPPKAEDTPGGGMQDAQTQLKASTKALLSSTLGATFTGVVSLNAN